MVSTFRTCIRGVEWGVIFTQVVGFLIVLGLLKKYAWGKLLDFIEHRRETIAAEFEGIEKSKQDVAGLRQNLENELADIEQTRRAKIQEAATEAHKLANDIKEDARKESLALQIKTKHDMLGRSSCIPSNRKACCATAAALPRAVPRGP